MLQRDAGRRPLNVLVATPGGGTGQGGIDRIMAALAREIERQAPADMDVRLMATRGNGPAALSGFHLLRFCAAMARARLSGRLDVVHINLASYGSTYRKLVVAALARALRLPYVLHLHGGRYRSFWSDKDGFLPRRIRAMFRGASRVIVLGSPWRAFVAGRVPETTARIVTLPNATEPPRLPHAGGGENVHIVFLGRLVASKGVPQLVEALAGMRERPGWRATIAGDGPEEELRRDIAARGLADRVAVPGWLGGEDVARLLAAGDILALPSLEENLPISIIEAMAGGLAVVATPVGAVEDIVRDGQTGLLVPPGDAASLAGALIRLVEDRALRERLGRAGQALHRECLTIAPYAERMLSLWREAARGGRDRPVGEAASTGVPESGR